MYSFKGPFTVIPGLTGNLLCRWKGFVDGRGKGATILAPLYRSLLHDVFQSLRRVGKALDGELVLLVPQAGPTSSNRRRYPCRDRAFPLGSRWLKAVISAGSGKGEQLNRRRSSEERFKILSEGIVFAIHVAPLLTSGEKGFVGIQNEAPSILVG